MRELQEMVTTLSHLAHNCYGDDRPDCPILTSLGEDDSADNAKARKATSLGKGFEKKADARR